LIQFSLHAASEVQHHGQIILRPRKPLVGCQFVPAQGGRKILFRAAPLFMKRTEIALRTGDALLGGELVILERLCVIRRHPAPARVHCAEVKLCRRVARIRRERVPIGRLREIFSNSIAAFQTHRQPVLRLVHSPFGGFAQPLHRGRRVAL